MTQFIHPVALFRLMVLGPLTARTKLERGELKQISQDLSEKSYNIPTSLRMRLSAKTIERWYYQWLRHGVDGLIPQKRCDKGTSQLSEAVVDALLQAKKERPSRSINTLITLLKQQGVVANNELSRSSVHRLLKNHNLSKRTLGDSSSIERRAFEAEHAGDIWYSDVMHGPAICTSQGQRKTYLVTFFDDATRLICHSSFYLNEASVSVEHAFKEALLKRGMPKMLVVDNGSAYRAGSLQMICARLNIRLVYCRPYEPEGKGKLERWHRTLRESFLTEINLNQITSLDDFNARLWVWIEKIYHQSTHQALPDKQTPLERWLAQLIHVRSLTGFENIHEYFYHRVERLIRKDATLSFEGKKFEVDFSLVAQTIYIVYEPHDLIPKWIEAKSFNKVSDVWPLDKTANLTRQRQRTQLSDKTTEPKNQDGLVDIIYKNTQQQLGFDDNQFEENK